ncbi:TetR/AcrR family transcriptional regulator [Bacillus sinesaloumensis]|uniref:TetR/AcrR family transcriptional regulator n=1 Tax=Litchfieldia sinesaloumensis TaxID=1926280 RepID=UPI00098880C7|nr:TetR/AcrR family transcriptional regulator [Bacillus sinesaloumensis]
MKNKITEQSILLFQKKGFSETSIQDIVDALGVTKGTFYYYFSSKEELLKDIQLGYINELLEEQEEIIAKKDINCKTKLFEILYLLLRNIDKNGASAKVFFREMINLSDQYLAQIIPKRDQFRINIQEVLQEGKNRGEFRSDLSIDITTFGILGMVNWSYQWFNPTGTLSEQEVANIYIDMILNGINSK